jgi:hypothetical protein
VQQAGGSLRDKGQDNASRAARQAGAGPKAATGDGQCAATVRLSDVTIRRLIKGYTAYKAPAKELRWNGRDEARLAVRPEALGPIEELRREVEQAEGPGKAQAECMHLGRQIKPRLVSDDEGLDINWLTERKQTVLRDASVTWRWNIKANQTGSHRLILRLSLTEYTYTRPEKEVPLPFPVSPFDDYVIHVNATRWQVLTDFLDNQWQVFVPVFRSS